MGIKNIHFVLIGASAVLALVFGMWGLSHEYALLGGGSLIVSAALVAYGVLFFKKAKSL